MYGFLHELLADKTGGAAFKCFDLFHICFIVFFVAAAVLLCLFLKNKTEAQRKKAADIAVGTAFGLYVAELFLMPFAYGVIHIEKLPFHVCTTMCVACFLSRHTALFGKFRLQFAMLGFLSNLTYLIYPAGMMWKSIAPTSYRVVQTLIFHGVMMVYGLLVLVYESREFTWKKIYKDLAVVAAMTLWALLGNTLYNHDEYFYNWFYVVQDPFNAFPESIAPYMMPFINTGIFFAAGLLVYLVLSTVSAKLKKKQPAA